MKIRDMLDVHETASDKFSKTESCKFLLVECLLQFYDTPGETIDNYATYRNVAVRSIRQSLLI